MVGGGAVFFALANEKRFEEAWINDTNPELINAYQIIQQLPDHLIQVLRKMKNTEKEFLKWRAKDLSELDEPTRAARFIYLNKTCFNGLHRVNKKGQFNVPFGHYENPKICDEENLLACSDALHRSWVTITCQDYQKTPELLDSKDVMYLDPPYVPKSETANFVAYTSGGFDHKRLSDWVSSDSPGRGTILLSNSDTPITRKLYKGFEIHKTDVRRAINREGDKRGHVGEILVVVNGKKKSKKRSAV